MYWWRQAKKIRENASHRPKRPELWYFRELVLLSPSNDDFQHFFCFKAWKNNDLFRSAPRPFFFDVWRPFPDFSEASKSSLFHVSKLFFQQIPNVYLLGSLKWNLGPFHLAQKRPKNEGRCKGPKTGKVGLFFHPIKFWAFVTCCCNMDHFGFLSSNFGLISMTCVFPNYLHHIASEEPTVLFFFREMAGCLENKSVGFVTSYEQSYIKPTRHKS